MNHPIFIILLSLLVPNLCSGKNCTCPDECKCKCDILVPDDGSYTIQFPSLSQCAELHSTWSIVTNNTNQVFAPHWTRMPEQITGQIIGQQYGGQNSSRDYSLFSCTNTLDCTDPGYSYSGNIYVTYVTSNATYNENENGMELRLNAVTPSCTIAMDVSSKSADNQYIMDDVYYTNITCIYHLYTTDGSHPVFVLDNWCGNCSNTMKMSIDNGRERLRPVKNGAFQATEADIYVYYTRTNADINYAIDAKAYSTVVMNEEASILYILMPAIFLILIVSAIVLYCTAFDIDHNGYRINVNDVWLIIVNQSSATKCPAPTTQVDIKPHLNTQYPSHTTPH